VLFRSVTMGANATGASINWCDVESVQGTYDWSYVDWTIQNTQAHGLAMFAYTGNTPDWALDPSILAKYGPGVGYRFPPSAANTGAFTKFFTAVAARYAGKIQFYEFWNEPNGCSWINDGCSNGNMAPSYTSWLKLWSQAMRAGDPGATLSVGGLDCNWSVTGCGQYISDIYAAGGGDYFDAVALHPYGQPSSAQNSVHWDAVADVYAVMVANGDGHKAVLVNEYGWDSSDEDFKSQALLSALHGFSSSNFSYVTYSTYLALTDLPGTPDSQDGWGLCAQDTTTESITPRPSYSAFQTFLRG